MNKIEAKQYCPDLFSYQRLKTREVKIGNIAMGGENPIRLQSMTTTDTMATAATVDQSIRMIEAGSELVRITAPSKKDAENLLLIQNALKERGFEAPLVADIHFTPNAAEIAAKIVAKVRVNPGNYADKKKFEEHDYTDEGYAAELVRIKEKFLPLVHICKEHGTAMRIGTNHGSLSDRIMSRYGDTPLGMVESAMEFIRICEEEAYYDLVISMKASNPQVMVQAYRLLVHTMLERGGPCYPLHLGVTEAGEGEDGRIKSAVGIGTLLEDGLGDTIRVSLTEEPEAEIPVARALAARYEQGRGGERIAAVASPIDPFSFHRRATQEVQNVGEKNVPVVVADLSHLKEIKPAALFPFGCQYSVPLDKWSLTDTACDFAYVADKHVDFEIPGTLGIIQDLDTWKGQQDRPRHYPLLTPQQYHTWTGEAMHFVQTDRHGLESIMDQLKQDANAVLVLTTKHEHGMAEQRAAFFELIHAGCEVPVIVKRSSDEQLADPYQLYTSSDFGALLIDGLGDGLWSVAPQVPAQLINQTVFGVLQATRMRISKTEYISCPSCGRTLFDLQETTAKIRKRTDHLKGVKIGIMGCIVNGPGEMADADYGYVGTGVGKITLYKEKEVVQRNIPEKDAVDALIDLIREHGDWVEREMEGVV